jgi:hypothetical protein
MSESRYRENVGRGARGAAAREKEELTGAVEQT